MDSIKIYLKDIHSIPLLSSEEEITLARQVQQGDTVAKNKMIRANLRLVINIAKHYIHLGLPLSDLIEEGNLGLMKSIEKFDPKKGFRLSTYATWWIKQTIARALINQGKLIRIPVYMNNEISHYRKTQEQLSHELKRLPSALEIAKKMNLSVDRVYAIETATARIVSLESPIGNNNEGTFKNTIEDKKTIPPDEQMQQKEKAGQIQKFLMILDDRERKILNMHYGLKDGHPCTFTEIAKILKVSRERVRQIEEAVFNKIRYKFKTIE